MQACSAFLMMSLLTNCQAEVLSLATYCTAEKSSSVCLVTTSGMGHLVTTPGISIKAVLVLSALVCCASGGVSGWTFLILGDL